MTDGAVTPLQDAFGRDAVERLERACGDATVVDQAGGPDVIRVDLAWGKSGCGRVLLDRQAGTAHWANLDVPGLEVYKTMCAKLPRLWRSFGLGLVLMQPADEGAAAALLDRGQFELDPDRPGFYRWVL